MMYGDHKDLRSKKFYYTEVNEESMDIFMVPN